MPGSNKSDRERKKHCAPPHYTKEQKKLKEQWEARRVQHKSPIAAKGVNAGTRFVGRFMEATGERPSPELINAYGCAGSDWSKVLDRIAEENWGWTSDPIADAVVAEASVMARKDGIAFQTTADLKGKLSFRHIYCVVAERLDVEANTFDAAVKRVELAYRNRGVKTQLRKFGVLGTIAIRVGCDRVVIDPETFCTLRPGVIHYVPDSPYWRRRLRDGDIQIAAD